MQTLDQVAVPNVSRTGRQNKSAGVARLLTSAVLRMYPYLSKAYTMLRMSTGTISANTGLLQAGAAQEVRSPLTRRTAAYRSTVPGA